MAITGREARRWRANTSEPNFQRSLPTPNGTDYPIPPLHVDRARDRRRQRERFYLALYILILGSAGARYYALAAPRDGVTLNCRM